MKHNFTKHLFSIQRLKLVFGLFFISLLNVNAQYNGSWGYIDINYNLSTVGPNFSFGGDTSVSYLVNNLLFISKDNGKSFKVKKQFSTPVNPKSAITVTDSMIVCAWDSFFQVSYNSGESWDTLILRDAENDTIIKLGIINLYHFWRNGKALIISGYNQTDSCYNVLLSNDFGNTWIKNNCSNIKISNIDGIGNNLLFPIHHQFYNVIDDKIFTKHPESENKIIRIYDYGNKIEEYTWDSSTYGTVQNLAFIDSLNGIVFVTTRFNLGVEWECYKTNDGGKTFKKNNLWISGYKRAVSTAAYQTDIAESFYILYLPITNGQDNYNAISIDKGETWYEYFPPNDNEIIYMKFKNAEIGVGIFFDLYYGFRFYYYRDNRSSSVPKNHTNYNIIIYPNPTTSEINISGISKADYSIQDMSGRTIQNGFFENSINVSELTQGVYILTISTDNQRYVRKIVKE
ncbi:MAG: T9SS type A sorting domain-containing protein [Bacteroidetes bacterium]|nr:T9SS type A sorting domain-containing protein [Bacteroidota bacterium]